VSVEELRAWLEIEEHALPSVKNPRKRAIDVSKAELDKKADLTFTYQPTKTGRRGLDRQGIYFRQFRSCYTVCSRDFLLSVQSNRPTGCQK
jgi:hypothetical protein